MARFNDLILIESDTELECYRLDLLDAIGNNTHIIKREVEKLLGVKVRGVRAVGPVTNATYFSDDSDIEVAIYVNSNTEFNANTTTKVQEHFNNFTLEDLGVITTLVYFKG